MSTEAKQPETPAAPPAAKPKRKPPAGWKPPAKDPVTGKFLKGDGSPGSPKPKPAAAAKRDDGWKLLVVVGALLLVAWALGGRKKGPGPCGGAAA